MKIVKSFEDYGLLINQTIENETEELIGGFLGMLVGILGASFLGNMLAGKDEGKGSEVIRNTYCRTKFLMLSHTLTNFEIQVCVIFI